MSVIAASRFIAHSVDDIDSAPSNIHQVLNQTAGAKGERDVIEAYEHSNWHAPTTKLYK